MWPFGRKTDLEVPPVVKLRITPDFKQETLTCQFATGEVLEIKLQDFEPFLRKLALLGLDRRVRNACVNHPPSRALPSVQRLLDRLRAGLWELRGGTKPKPPAKRLQDLATAICRAASQQGLTLDPAHVVQKLSAMSKERQRALRRNPAVSLELARLRIERTKAQPQLAEMLG
jgi:hypothetical protein